MKTLGMWRVGGIAMILQLHFDGYERECRTEASASSSSTACVNSGIAMRDATSRGLTNYHFRAIDRMVAPGRVALIAGNSPIRFEEVKRRFAIPC